MHIHRPHNTTGEFILMVFKMTMICILGHIDGANVQWAIIPQVYQNHSQVNHTWLF